MKIYLAAPWKQRSIARHVAQEIRDAGHTITSRWHDEWGVLEDTSDPILLAAEARMDVQDVLKAERLIVLNLEKSEGKAVEQGIALANNIPIIIIGDLRFNVFQYLPSVTLVSRLDEALSMLN